MLRRLFGLATSAADRGAYYLRVMVPAQIAARNSSRDLKPVQDRTAAIQAGDMIVFCVLRDDAERIPLFLQYYRDLGVGHFIFIDNGSGGRLQGIVAAMSDVSLWRTDASYAQSCSGAHWLNHLLRTHGVGHWCLTVNADELLVYPHVESRSLRELTEYLSMKGLPHLPCLVIDTYAESVESDLQSGIDPREVSRLFDRSGYSFKPAGRGCHVQGGSRARMFFPEDLDRAPALNKVPLVLWSRRSLYLNSTHQLAPRGLNSWMRNGSLRVTGALLRSDDADLMQDKSGKDWRVPDSAPYRSSQSLIDCGLMTAGSWF